MCKNNRRNYVCYLGIFKGFKNKILGCIFFLLLWRKEYLYLGKKLKGYEREYN